MANHRSHLERQGLKWVKHEAERESNAKSGFYHEGHEEREENIKSL
jgi:hypothetical protein